MIEYVIAVVPWNSLLILAAKLNQEGYKNIKEFIWCLCVGYHYLNIITRSFEFLFPAAPIV